GRRAESDRTGASGPRRGRRRRERTRWSGRASVAGGDRVANRRARWRRKNGATGHVDRQPDLLLRPKLGLTTSYARGGDRVANRRARWRRKNGAGASGRAPRR